MRGRKPTPSAINEVLGNPGKRARRKNEPKPPEGVPECPDHLNDAAKQEWFRIAPELLAVGLLSKVDRAALAGYCVAFARWQEAERQVETTGGMVVKAPSGYPIQNPYLSIANKALEDVRKFLVEFGMSPSSRTRIGASNEKPKPQDPADAYFGGPRAVS